MRGLPRFSGNTELTDSGSQSLTIPNVWFGYDERVASARIGRETVTYVSNIYKYYVAYRLIEEDRARREASRQAVTAGAR